MEGQDIGETLTALLAEALDKAVQIGAMVTTPGWRQYQILILLGFVALAYVLRLVASGPLERWIRAREGWQKWQLRLLVQLR
ncbi:mechanosensitive ion channel family protein, partial [Cribrihabitans sp. XS_ASV171]